VHVTGLQLRDAACWMQNYLNCEDLLIEHPRVENQANFNMTAGHRRLPAGDRTAL
jgi:hypothetical protein